MGALSIGAASPSQGRPALPSYLPSKNRTFTCPQPLGGQSGRRCKFTKFQTASAWAVFPCVCYSGHGRGGVSLVVEGLVGGRGCSRRGLAENWEGPVGPLGFDHRVLIQALPLTGQSSNHPPSEQPCQLSPLRPAPSFWRRLWAMIIGELEKRMLGAPSGDVLAAWRGWRSRQGRCPLASLVGGVSSPQVRARWTPGPHADGPLRGGRHVFPLR